MRSFYDIGEMQRIGERNLPMRQELAEKAENIVAEEVARLEAQFREHIARTITSLQDRFESFRREVLARYRPKLGVFTVNQEEALEALTRSLVNKIAHLPISEIRRQAVAKNGHQENRDGGLISAVRQIFRLSDAHREYR